MTHNKSNDKLLTPEDLASYFKTKSAYQAKAKKEKQQKLLADFTESFNKYLKTHVDITEHTKCITIPLHDIADKYLSFGKNILCDDRLLDVIEKHLTKHGWQFKYDKAEIADSNATTPVLVLEFDYQKYTQKKADKKKQIKSKPYYSMDVANYIVQHFIDKGTPITNALLNKILYYLQADSLRLTHEPLFDDPIEKWGYGATFPIVYSYFRLFDEDGFALTGALKYVVIDSEDKSWHLMNPDEIDLAESDKVMINKLADEIYQKYCNNSFALVKMTRNEPMWQKDKAEIIKGNMHIQYTNAELEDYFSKHWTWDN